jgi:hypothetical protein
MRARVRGDDQDWWLARPSSSRRPLSWHVQTSGPVQGVAAWHLSHPPIYLQFPLCLLRSEDDDVLPCAGGTGRDRVLLDHLAVN